jgi:hypothetical protein
MKSMRKRNNDAHDKNLVRNKTIGEEARMETNEFSSAWKDGAKKAVELYLESGEKLGKMMLEWHEQSTSWAKKNDDRPAVRSTAQRRQTVNGELRRHGAKAVRHHKQRRVEAKEGGGLWAPSFLSERQRPRRSPHTERSDRT